MLVLNSTDLKPASELRRLAMIADVDNQQLMALTGLGESAINNYLSDDCSRSNYLFQFALEFLAFQKLEEIAKGEGLIKSQYTTTRLAAENRLMLELLRRVRYGNLSSPTKQAIDDFLERYYPAKNNESVPA